MRSVIGVPMRASPVHVVSTPDYEQQGRCPQRGRPSVNIWSEPVAESRAASQLIKAAGSTPCFSADRRESIFLTLAPASPQQSASTSPRLDIAAGVALPLKSQSALELPA